MAFVDNWEPSYPQDFQSIHIKVIREKWMLSCKYCKSGNKREKNHTSLSIGCIKK